MTKGVFIVGTDTDVGKTIVTAGLIHVLRSNGLF
ncbi:dithiobiotin synthetase [Clostridium vincentii]|uniref:Dithiobiotin synthetase n=1 Tax=Clostridium vincentii TaxID=52704 RepID=A0A2T0BKA3_9CLOT|nr:dithiobiotin synthetase [Clostridium vincentii]